MKDMTPVVRLVLEPAVVAVKSDAPYKTLKDFIDAAKAEAGPAQAVRRLDHAAATTSCASCCMKKTGANWAFISFPGGGERIAALLGGHVNMMVIEPQEAGEHIRAGNMRVLAQVDRQAPAGFPNVPTLKEAGVDVPMVPQVRGIVAPPGIPGRCGRVLRGSLRAAGQDGDVEEVSRGQPVRGRLPAERASSRRSSTSSPNRCATSSRKRARRWCDKACTDARRQ